MNEMDLKLYEFTQKLRRKADECADMAIGNEKNRPNLTVKLCGMMEAYREVAEMIEQEFRDSV